LYGGDRHCPAGERLVLVTTFTLTSQKQSLRCPPFRPIRGDPPGMGSQEPGYSTARIWNADRRGPIASDCRSAVPWCWSLATTSCMRAASPMSENVIYERNVTYARRQRRRQAPVARSAWAPRRPQL